MGASNKKLSTAEFITRAQAVHGVDTYDYSQALYIDAHAKLTVICPQHGPFAQQAGGHLSGRSCPRCSEAKRGNSRRLSQKQFIEKAHAVHGVGTYDYSQAVYVNNCTKLTILCPQHGPFEQKPSNHLFGKGCARCGDKRVAERMLLTTAQFIEKAHAVHGVGTYDYSQAVYAGGNKTKLAIVCPQHGEFEQAPSKHLSGQGCPTCGRITGGRQLLTTAQFIEKAHAVHGVGTYDYSRTVCVSGAAKLTIVCPRHGEFEQLAFSHYNGQGCNFCAGLVRGKKLRLTTAQFIEKARAVHGVGIYDYSQAEYATSATKLTIICPQHGPFEQAAGSHLAGHGCATCADESSRQSWIDQANGRPATLYFLRIFNDIEEFYKVGVTLNSVKERFKGGTTRLATYHYEILAQHTSTNAAAIYDWEQSILETFKHISYLPTSYFPGHSECFSSAEEILSIFPL
jgi:hypothetical protein